MTQPHPSRPIPSDRRWLAVVLAFAAATRVAYLLWYRAFDPLYGYLLHDAKRYHEWAMALAQGRAWEPGPFHQAPLYPYLLSFVYRVLGPHPLAIYALQLFSGLLVLLLVHRIARRTFGEGPALVAAALGALYAPFVFYETKLLPASLSVLLAATAIDRIQIARESKLPRAWIWPGLALGAGALTNPGFLLFAALLVSWMLFDRTAEARGKPARIAVVCASAALIVLPVTLRNAMIAHEPVLISTNGGITFYQGNNPAARGVFSTPEGFSGSIFRQREESRRLAEAESGGALTDSQVSRFWMKKGLRYLVANPAAAAALEGRKLLLLLGNREQPLEYNPHTDPNPLRFLLPLPFALLLGLAAARFFAGPLRRTSEVPIVLLLAAQAGVLLLFYVSGRYRLPAIPALLLLAGTGAETLGRLARGSARRALAPLALAGAAAVFSFCGPSLAAPELRRLQDAISLCDRAEAVFRAGDRDRAVEGYREAIELYPAYPFAHLDLAKVLSAKGDRAGAEKELRAAIERAPSLAEAHVSLGVVLYEEGRLDEAATAFADAVRLDPRDGPTANNLLGTLLRLGRREDAFRAWRGMKERGLPVDPPLEARIREIEQGLR